MSPKIYTKTGDKGETGYIGGRISKSDPLIELIGELDELNAMLGLVIAEMDHNKGLQPLVEVLLRAQSQLFSIGALCADKDDKMQFQYSIKDWTKELEKEIDSWQSDLPELKNFILPGGTKTAAQIHLARAICRRVERTGVKVDSSKLTEALVYLNRLSDWLFVAARYANSQESKQEVLWVNA